MTRPTRASGKDNDLTDFPVPLLPKPDNLDSYTLLVKAARKALWSELLCTSAIFWAITLITFSIQYIGLKKHHQKCARAIIWARNGDVLGQNDLYYRATTPSWGDTMGGTH